MGKGKLKNREKMSEKIFNQMISVKFSDLEAEMPDELRRISCEAAAKGVHRSGGTLKRYAEAANKRKKQIVQDIQGLLNSFWDQGNDANIDLPSLAVKEAQTIFIGLDRHVKSFIDSVSYQDVSRRAIEEIHKILDKETKGSLNKIRDIADIIVAGFSLAPSSSIAYGDTIISVNGPMLINSIVHGDLLNNIHSLEKNNPASAKDLQTILDTFNAQLKDNNPELLKESVEILSNIAEEAVKPEDKQRKAIFSTGLKFLKEAAQSFRDVEKIYTALNNLGNWLST